jgi:hypothetical protein
MPVIEAIVARPGSHAALPHQSIDPMTTSTMRSTQLGATCWVRLIEGRLGRSASPQKR